MRRQRCVASVALALALALTLTMKLNVLTLLLFAATVSATVDLPPLPPLIVSLLLDMIGAKQANATVAMSQTTPSGGNTETVGTFSSTTLSASCTST